MVKINSENLPGWYQRLCPILEACGVSLSCPIAGSFALWLWQVHTTGKAPSWTPSDVDFWVSSDTDMMRVFSNIQLLYPGATLEQRGPAIVEIRVAEDLPTLQFIHRNPYGQKRPAPLSFLNMFDLSVAQVAIEYFDGGSVNFAFGDDEVKTDIATGMTRCFRDMSVAETNTPARLAKYHDRGFQTRQGEIRPIGNWGFYYVTGDTTVTVDWKTFQPARLICAPIMNRGHANIKWFGVGYMDPDTDGKLLPFRWQSPSQEAPLGVLRTLHGKVFCQNITDPEYLAFLRSVDERLLTLHGHRDQRFSYSPIVSSTDPPRTRSVFRAEKEVPAGSDTVAVFEIPIIWFCQSLCGSAVRVKKISTQ